MPRRNYDPLSVVPSPHVIRKQLADTLDLAGRLQILLELSERVHQNAPPTDGARSEQAEEAERV